MATASAALAAPKWLPLKQAPQQKFRLLECTYNQAQLEKCTEITSDSSWKATTDIMSQGEKKLYQFTFTAKQNLENAGVAVAFDRYNWTSDNYLMIPASVYNGNRQRIVNRQYATGLDPSDYYRKDLALTSNPIPQLSPEFGAESRLEVLVNNTATPAIVLLERANQKGSILLTDQGIEYQNQMLDNALIVEESPDRSIASIVISAPGVREKKPEFIGFSPSPDRGISVQTGDQITLRITEISFSCPDVPTLLERFMLERKTHIPSSPLRNLIPMSEVFTQMVKNIDERYYTGDTWQYYCPENANWISFGWIGGLINTYPILALNDKEHDLRVQNTFDFALPRAKGKSGYYYDVLGADGNVFYRDASLYNKKMALTRRNADILYWMTKQFMLLKAMDKTSIIRPEWEENIRLLAEAFVNTWQKHHTWGNYLEVESGNIAAYNTTGGAIAPAGLALASQYYNFPQYLEVASQAAESFWNQFSLIGFTSGGCGDILQNADSETAIALTTSFITLYEITGQKLYLDRAKHLAHLCATWTVSFPYRLPANTPLARLGANLTGAVWASTQNKHGAPGFCTQSGDALFKIYRATGSSLYAELLRDIIHAHAEGIQPNGKITERLTYCDADSRGSRGDGGKTGWNETNGALMALEIPGIYIRTDLPSLFVFDHIKAEIIDQNTERLILRLKNPTNYNATVTLLAENAHQASLPLGENAFLNWDRKISIKAGESVEYTLPITQGN